MAPENEAKTRNLEVIQRLNLKPGALADLDWVAVTRAGKSARNEGAVHSVSSSDEIVEAFGRRARDSVKS